MFLLPIVALMIGAVVAVALRVPLDPRQAQYLAIACLAGLDSILGGVRAGLENRFQNDVFVTGFFGNVIVAFFLAWFGDQIYINMFLAVALALGTRSFNNLSFIRRLVIQRYEDAIRQRRVAAEAARLSGTEAPSEG